MRRCRSPGKQAPLRIHSSLEPQAFQRLKAPAGRDGGSMSRIVRRAVLAFLESETANSGGHLGRAAVAEQTGVRPWRRRARTW
jgi:hypothetical protein